MVAIAGRGEVPTPIRVEALELLGDWAKASGRDRITGLWRPYAARPTAEAANAVKGRLDDLLKPGTESVRLAAINAVGNLGISEAVPTLMTLVADAKLGHLTRVAALRAIERIGDPRLTEAVATAVESNDATLRAEGQKLATKTDPARAIPRLGKVLANGSIEERQSALAVLATLAKPDADAIISSHLAANDLPREVELDLLDAATVRSVVPAIKASLDARAGRESKADPLSGYHGVLFGGDATKGRAIFETSTAVYCLRCHKVKGQGGEVGPDLTGIGARQSREYLATSIIVPNHAIAQGFETVVVATADGKVVSGVFRAENEKTLTLMGVDNRPIVIAKSEIEDRKRGPSAMPDDVAKKLKKSQIRDLVEFLATLR